LGYKRVLDRAAAMAEKQGRGLGDRPPWQWPPTGVERT
jgi:hypothetical protein